MTKPPSAELAPDQRDDDTLPPYETLDGILKLHIEQGLGAEDIAEHGYDHSTVVTVLQRLEANEHKRWQMAPGSQGFLACFRTGMASSSCKQTRLASLNDEHKRKHPDDLP